MTIALMGILLVLGFDPLSAVLTSVASVWFYRFVEMWGD